MAKQKEAEHTVHCSDKNWFWLMTMKLYLKVNSADDVLDYLRGVVDARGNRIQPRARGTHK